MCHTPHALKFVGVVYFFTSTWKPELNEAEVSNNIY